MLLSSVSGVLVAACLLRLGSALPTHQLAFWGPVLPDRPSQGPAYEDPRIGNGSMFAIETDGVEPLNIIISARSSPAVLTLDGLLSFAESLRFERECARLHFGDPQQANLGDGQGYIDELVEIRQARYKLPIIGTCIESALGGSHFRAWRQRSTGAWFLAVSLERSARYGHVIDEDGYDAGRDNFVDKATPESSYRGRKWQSTVERIEGLIPPTRHGLNHHLGTNGQGEFESIEPL